MLKKKLEIAIITYNRNKCLDDTLKQLSKSPFCNVKITILDNHSSDATPEVCRRYQGTFPQLKIIRHRKNIGGGPNYLRAIQKSTSAYTWVLCDDDNYDFSSCDDFIDAILRESCDLIWVSFEHLDRNLQGIKTTTTDLVRRGARYYPALSFVPAVIFRTELFDSDCFQQGYRYYENWYPQFYFIHKSVVNNFSIYIARNPIITRGTGSTGVSPFSQYSAWVKCCLSISERNIRVRAIEDLTVDGGGISKVIFGHIAFERLISSFNRKRFWKDVVLINLAYNMKQRLFFFVVFLPALLFPKAVLHFLRRVRYAYGAYKNAHSADAYKNTHSAPLDTQSFFYKIRYALWCYNNMHAVDFDRRDMFDD